MQRLRGVYSNMQVWKPFDQAPNKMKRILLMDTDMLPRSNMDELMANNVPSAVMRGEADTCLHTPKPKATFFERGHASSFMNDNKKMKGGINGGLILLKPDKTEREALQAALAEFKPVTETAEQEFLSYYYGRLGMERDAQEVQLPHPPFVLGIRRRTTFWANESVQLTLHAVEPTANQ